MKYYLAYGSNLSVAQMLTRCPSAYYVGYAFIPNYQLAFRRSYLTIDPRKGATAPVLVWCISDSDEAALDRYEGYPTFYRKQEASVEVLSLITHEPVTTVPAMVYVMNKGFPIEPPTAYYWKVCTEGYSRFGFDRKYLDSALARATRSVRA